MIRHLMETEETRKIIANLAKGNNSEMERWIQTCTELSGLDDEEKKTEANGIRRALEARRKGQGRQPTAAQEQGKRVCFTADEVHKAREWQENFLRTREAREREESEDDDDEWAPVVPNMEAGGSHLQTADPRNMVEKIVMDELEAKQEEKVMVSLVRERVYTCQANETNGKGKGKGEGGKGEHEGKGERKGTPQNTRKAQDEEEEVRGEDKCREAKFQRDL